MCLNSESRILFNDPHDNFIQNNGKITYNTSVKRFNTLHQKLIIDKNLTHQKLS